MEISFYHDLDKVFKSKFGRFGIFYYSQFIIGNKKLEAKDNFENIFNYCFHTVGKLAVFYLKIATNVHLRLLSEKELEELKDSQI
ncbi:hypothetical protein A2962_02570 [Candidatus Woesebacteria bacterium RIFCSPLOWO2_01_FULL_39_61]|uniref:Uncharacterized protein n=1 Tax=Candidatus Woesebacteria bacterium RIFCSPHIGHO2_02_FULL_39_13 TaxID=1802505 RepID=A0A1F7Z6D0_9BACT|nr:MAG: hypothetical protein A2692_02890 [Candidatus Woesebacteria bacterium RIFCSPHIGHO2_01_FULL_39_95]OGM34679.1 MAG: hypothetical protein A3D01_04095 [Candidatus Woesebacteria bacterium RIFCSPHIGHO2_02_FULL_39_13]OGM38688.1 MAG: hypothetical protein A3E13_04470 [Candidatus Woesebacteria bacterium RIFCSPHIGHO2_12_FULL_40_20]OGM67222.1 MAG: hypothetical protein A2962_02570 [Candidatus Woesebacteria bacterium RIFCSPLOWO2_01_FULL_39_61]OGM75410.1 MAG: hypothetical protein A3H19_03535 [Candidatus